MKKLIILLIPIIFLLTNCASDSESSYKQESTAAPPVIIEPTPEPDGDTTTDTETEPETPTPENPGQTTPPESAPIPPTITTPEETTPETDTTSDFYPNIIITNSTGAYLSDGTEINQFLTGYTQYLSGKTVLSGLVIRKYTTESVFEVIHEFDTEPHHAAITTLGDVYHCIQIDPETAQSLGAQPKYYSEFFKNGISLDPWYLNATQCHGFKSIDDIVWNINQNGGYYLIDGTPLGPVEHIQNNEFYIHSFDSLNKKVSFNDLAAQDFVWNNILASKNWIELDGLFYAENGYTWSEITGLTENTGVLWGWNDYPYPTPDIPFASSPNFAAAGTHDGELYWIELNTGWLYKYNPALDEITFLYRIYVGDGTNETADLHPDIRPLIVWPYLYYYSMGWFQMDLETGFVELFFAGNGEIYEW